MAEKEHLFNEEYVTAAREDLRRLQYWFKGFEAAGGKLPQCVSTSIRDPLWVSIRLIDECILPEYSKES